MRSVQLSAFLFAILICIFSLALSFPALGVPPALEERDEKKPQGNSTASFPSVDIDAAQTVAFAADTPPCAVNRGRTVTLRSGLRKSSAAAMANGVWTSNQQL
ncbi:hypothetical protein FRC07_012446 [Ceratobasidium sp. 392]|nr:hypothetical protein FRC07_012446 [Ceratobasidium sp. 392]